MVTHIHLCKHTSICNKIVFQHWDCQKGRKVYISLTFSPNTYSLTQNRTLKQSCREGCGDELLWETNPFEDEAITWPDDLFKTQLDSGLKQIELLCELIRGCKSGTEICNYAFFMIRNWNSDLMQILVQLLARSTSVAAEEHHSFDTM